MKRMLLGLGYTLATGAGLFAQDGSPSARLRSSESPAATIRAQAPEISPASAFDIPKPIPKSTAEAPPATLPVPPTLSPNPTIPPTPAGPIPPGSIIIDPPGTPIPNYNGVPIPGLIPPAPEVSNWYTAAEALVWWMKSYSVPPLVTVGPAFSGANLSVKGVTSVFGADSVDQNPRYGGRLTLGYWLTPCWAVEANAFYIRPSSHGFTATSAETPSADLARPFFSLNQGVESSEIIGRPGVASGYVNITTKSNFYGAEINGRNKYWQDGNNRIDLLGGVRYLHLDEQLIINESSKGLAGAGTLAGVERSLTDSFQTKNRFLGVQVGAIFEHVEGPWKFDLRAKLAAGMTRETTDIQGAIVPIAGGSPPNLPGGLLALNSNIGSATRQKFGLVPEIGINVSYDVTSHLQVFGGYSFLYWTGVNRPGPQIDRVLDESRIPDFKPTKATTTIRPINPGASESLWAQGVNFGLIYKW
ncbi:MAG TPA: BBP7 family outer membrane beta-barrel protein [Gemmataceae bacterium]|jgi:hypothetical protein|nr:BBP7 family outer membrane beta-barrel protein [Gemmataceae bacterium]